ADRHVLSPAEAERVLPAPPSTRPTPHLWSSGPVRRPTLRLMYVAARHLEAPLQQKNLRAASGATPRPVLPRQFAPRTYVQLARRIPHMNTSVRRGVLVAIAAGTALTAGLPAHASSHREAPFITTMPRVDRTHFYMFRSY